MPAELSDKVILITGASSGIGAATAVACAEAGMHVTLAARREEKLKRVAQRCVAAGPPGIKAQWVVCDVDDDKAVRRAFAESWTYFGRLDAVFANAGVGLTKPVLATSLSDHQSIFNTNYLSTVRTLLVANEYFKRTPSGLGHFVICSSCLSDLGLPNNAVYSATKAAQKALADGLRAEVAQRGLYVTSVHPIGTRTEFFDTSAQRSGRDEPELHVPERRLQDPMKIGRGIVWALRYRRPEVWGSGGVRWAMALLNAAPTLKAWAMNRHYRKIAAQPTTPRTHDTELAAG
jgi:short-subunit dehydrogenase